MRVVRILLIPVMVLLAVAPTVRGQSFRARVVWIEKQPHVQVRFTGVRPKDVAALPFSMALYGQEPKAAWTGTGKIEFAEKGEPIATVAIEKLKDPKSRHRIHVALHDPALRLDFEEDIWFADAGRAVQSWSLRREGQFPFEHVTAAVTLGAVKDENVKDVKVGLTLRDASDSTIMEKLVAAPVGAKAPVSEKGTYQEVDVTPDLKSIGPYSLDCKIENDALGIYFSDTQAFAFANSLIPVSSFEFENDRLWWASGTRPYFRSLAYYYSPQLTEQFASDYPTVVFDKQVKSSGAESMRIDYTQGREASVFSRQVLPGMPTMVRLRVKGNKSNDKLMIHYNDHIDFTRPAWQRNANFGDYEVCTLDFDGWRTFRAPVLGGGMQALKSRAGSTELIDAPISILALSVRPGTRPRRGEKPRQRSVWVDDLRIETQARHDQRVTMEVRATPLDRRLRKDAKVYVTLGNGTTERIKDGKVRATVTDRAGKKVETVLETLSIEPHGFAVATIPLAEAFGASPRGPVDVDVSFVSPSAAGLRASERVTFANAQSAGLWWDFEKAEGFNAYFRAQRPYVAASKAEAKGGVLHLPVEPESQNPVMLHPSMPGQVDWVEVMIKGGAKPVRVQPLFVDNGLTGIWIRPFNTFRPAAITVDWQGWRKVEIEGPPPAAYWQDRTHYCFKEPYYPLNLLFEATVEGKEATAIQMDNIRVVTQLAPEEELMAHVDFPDDTMTHRPGGPLELVLTNFARQAKQLNVAFRLDSFQSRVEAQGAVPVTVPAGQKVKVALVKALRPGIYALTVSGLEGRTIHEYIQAVDAGRYFGKDALATLRQMPEIRKALDMMVEKVYLDWDNTEPVAGLFHFRWFDTKVKTATADGVYEATPVVGFCADWAGPHAQESIAKGTYKRFMGNYLQVPVRMADWSVFVRECLREFKGRFTKWVFWENPDLEGAPQTIPQSRYPELLSIFERWVRLYDPKAKVVAGGFNMDRALNYLERIEHPERLKFDEIAVQMNLGELSPERGDVEGFLDELDDLLKLRETGRSVQTTELDWAIGPYVSAAQQANYHTRALLILNSRGAAAQQFRLVNRGQEFEGPGILYRRSYGSSECLQTLKPFFVPKPAFFAMCETKRFLREWRFVRSVVVADFNLEANRAFVYRNASGALTAVLWRTTPDARVYEMPPGWKGARAHDAFGFAADTAGGPRLAGMPTWVALPAGYGLAQLVEDLRTMRAADGRDRVAAVIRVSEPDSCRRAHYTSTGGKSVRSLYGQIPSGRKLKADFVFGLTSEEFQFELAAAGNVLMRREWFMDEGQVLSVQLNGGPKRTWDLSKSKGSYAGIRESTWVLRGCKAGRNVVRIGYKMPGNCAGYRLAPLSGDHVALTRWGVLNALQTKGQLQKFRSASGTPLKIGKTSYASGLGSHAVALIEYPLDGQFSSFEVTVGVDAVTDGRGSVIFEIHVDGQQRATSGLMTGFSKPKTLKVEVLEDAKRLRLVVLDAGDKNQDDLADWVEGKLFLKK